MPSDDEEVSGSDSDDGLAADMEAIRNACFLTGENAGNNQLSLPSSQTAADSDTDSGTDSADEDLELVRNIQRQFATSTKEEPLALLPISFVPPGSFGSDDEYDDDLEAIRAIHRRFAAYSADILGDTMGGFSHKADQVGATNADSEKETSNNLFVERTNAGEGFPNYVDENSAATHNMEVSTSIVTEAESSNLIEWHSGADNEREPIVRNSGFPKSALAFIDAIKKNRSYQKFLRNKLIEIETKIEENRKLKERVKILKDFQISCRKRTGRALAQKKDARVQLISVPKLRANTKSNDGKIPALYYGPAENSHVANYRMVLAKNPFSWSREKWSAEEKENLVKGIKQQFQEMLLQKSIDQISCAEASLEGSVNLDSIVASVRDFDITPDETRSFLPKVNWEQLAFMYVPSRCAAECEARWLNCEDPLTNFNPWTNVEDKSLLHIVQLKGINNWINNAVSLGTNRTPFQCLARYQRSLNASILKREWTEDEDSKLRAAVETFGESNWQAVASMMEGRTGTQCSNRWIKSLHPARQRVGRWTHDEDKRMKVAVMLFGPKTWRKIAQFVPGRTHVQCRERWVNSLDPSLNLKKWTEDEDSRLEAAIAEYGYCWSKIASCLTPRTDNQCWRRWKVLHRHEVPSLQAARKLQRVALISNFVDRESERPSLRSDDFMSIPEISAICESDSVAHPEKKKTCSRKRSRHREEDMGSSCPETIPNLTYDNEIETSNGEMAMTARKRIKKRCSKNKLFTSQVEGQLASCSPTTSTSADANMFEILVGDDSFSRGKGQRLKRQVRKKKGTDLLQDQSFLATDAGEHDSSTAARIIKRKRKNSQLCSRECTEPSDKRHRSILSNMEISMTSADCIETVEGNNVFESENVEGGEEGLEIPPRCSTPDILESGNFRPLSYTQVYKGKRSQTKDDDDTSLVSCLTETAANKLKKGLSKRTRRSETVVCSQRTSKPSQPKRSRKKIEKCSNEIQKAEVEDHTTLAAFCKSLKRRLGVFNGNHSCG